MTEKTGIVEFGAAMTRAAIIIKDEVRRFWFGPAVGDEQLATPCVGQKFGGRVTKIDKALKAAFIDVGSTKPAFLNLSQSTGELHEGKPIAVEIKRAAVGEKGALVKLIEDAPTDIGPFEAVNVYREVCEFFEGAVNEIIVDQGAAATEIRQQLNVEIIHDNQNLFEKFGAEAALEEASNREILLPGGGGGVVIDEAEALTAIDVDVRQAGGPSDAALNKRINLAAARAIGQALALRNIGGQIAVDFLPAPESVRNELTSILKKHAPEIQKAHWTKSGLFTFIRPRIEASLLERATERVPGDPFGARQFTLDWQAKTAISRMESALRASPTANVEISAGEGLFAHFAKNAQWRDRIVERYGARLSFAKNDKLTERDFAIDQQR